jgi:hypothetical protein
VSTVATQERYQVPIEHVTGIVSAISEFGGRVLYAVPGTTNEGRRVLLLVTIWQDGPVSNDP